MVIHDDDLCVQALQGFADRSEAELQKIWNPVVDDNDGEDHGESIRELRLFFGTSRKIDTFAFVYLIIFMALSFKQIEKVSKALGDINRLKILYYLAGKGGCGECSALQGVIDLAQPSISHHVKILVESGLIEGEKEGRNYSYTINPGVLNEYIESLRKLESSKLSLQ
jgi:ArsR family transcriptional regulator